jgi:hypothetical protein
MYEYLDVATENKKNKLCVRPTLRGRHIPPGMSAQCTGPSPRGGVLIRAAGPAPHDARSAMALRRI